MMTPAQLKQARYAFAWGASVAQVARLTGCTVLTIALAQARGTIGRPAHTLRPIVGGFKYGELVPFFVGKA